MKNKLFLTLVPVALLFVSEAYATESISAFSAKFGFVPGDYRAEEENAICVSGTIEVAEGAEEGVLTFYGGGIALAREVGGAAFEETDKQDCVFSSESTVEEKKIIFTNRRTCKDEVVSSSRRTIDFQVNEIQISQVVNVGGKTHSLGCKLTKYEAEKVKPGPMVAVPKLPAEEEAPTVVIDEEY